MHGWQQVVCCAVVIAGLAAGARVTNDTGVFMLQSRASRGVLRAWFTETAVPATTIVVRKAAQDGKKCGCMKSKHRIFDLRDAAATESACIQACEADPTCVEFSGIFGSWCVGCDWNLTLEHDGAVAYGRMHMPVQEAEAVEPSSMPSQDPGMPMPVQKAEAVEPSSMPSQDPVVRKAAQDGKKCGAPGSKNRIFDLRDAAATESACIQACEADPTCVEFSGIFGSWCIGCDVNLAVEHGGAEAYGRMQMPLQKAEAVEPSSMPSQDPVVRKAAQDGKKCGAPGSKNRIFDLRDAAATESACIQACEADPTCVEFSGIFGSWCIGCDVKLTAEHGGAEAYGK